MDRQDRNVAGIGEAASAAAIRHIAAIWDSDFRLPIKRSLDYHPHSGRSAWQGNCFWANSDAKCLGTASVRIKN